MICSDSPRRLLTPWPRVPEAMKRTRVFQITVLLLVIVAAVTVGYWLYDQHMRGVERTAALTRLYDQQTAGARSLLTAGVPVARVSALYPDLYVSSERVALADDQRSALLNEQQQRLRQYLWEGGFFLLTMFACIGVIFAA